MVGVYQPRDIGGELGGMIGGGLGKGFGEGMEMLAQRNMLKSGIEKVEQDMQTRMQSGEKLNPMSVTLGLMKSLGGVPGGMQAISELAPTLHKEIIRSNLTNKGETNKNVVDPNETNKMPENSIIESDSISNDQSMVEGSEQTLFNADDYYKKVLDEEMQSTGDYEVASKVASARLSARSSEEARRAQEQATATSFLNSKIEESFPAGVAAPIKNEMDREYYDLLKTTDKNRAWNQTYPKYRDAQLAIENLDNATASKRPGLFIGNMNEKVDAARNTLKPITDIDPEFSMGLAMSKFNYGASEAAKIVKPGDEKYNKFTNQLNMSPSVDPKYPLSGNFRKDEEKYLLNTSDKVRKYLKNGWNPNENSLLAFRGELFDKGYPSKMFKEDVEAVYPELNKSKKLSVFNRNETSKLGEPVIPGLQELIPLLGTGKFGRESDKAIEYRTKGKR